MTTLSDAQATLEDLDADLGRYDASEDGNLRKLSAFSRAALYLHDSTPSPKDRARVDEGLHRIVQKHGLPAECVEGHWTTRKSPDSER